MKKKLVNKTPIKKGDTVYFIRPIISGKDCEKWTITNITVLSPKWIDVTVMIKGKYSWLPDLKEYEHLIARNDDRQTNLFLDEDFYYNYQEAMDYIRERRYDMRARDFYHSFMNVVEYVKRKVELG